MKKKRDVGFEKQEYSERYRPPLIAVEPLSPQQIEAWERAKIPSRDRVKH